MNRERLAAKLALAATLAVGTYLGGPAIKEGASKLLSPSITTVVNNNPPKDTGVVLPISPTQEPTPAIITSKPAPTQEPKGAYSLPASTDEDQLLKAYENEAEKKHQESLESLDGYQESLNPAISEGRYGIALIGKGSEGFLADGITLLVVNTQKRQVDMFPIARDIQSPEVYKALCDLERSRINQMLTVTSAKKDCNDSSKGSEPVEPTGMVRRILRNAAGVQVPYFIIVEDDFPGKFMDKAGITVDMNIKEEVINNDFTDKDNNPVSLHLNPGYQTLDGTTVNYLLRNRKNYNDYGRGEMHEEFIQALVRTISASSRNPIELSRIMINGSDYIRDERASGKLQTNLDFKIGGTNSFDVIVNAAKTYITGRQILDSLTFRSHPSMQSILEDAKVPGQAITRLRGKSVTDPELVYWQESRDVIQRELSH